MITNVDLILIVVAIFMIALGVNAYKTKKISRLNLSIINKLYGVKSNVEGKDAQINGIILMGLGLFIILVITSIQIIIFFQG